MRNLVFAYGTLRKGESNHHFLESSKLLGNFCTPPRYTMYNIGPYPGLIEGDTAIVGEVYEVDDATLQMVDELEGVPDMYRRDSVETPFGTAIIYIFQDKDYLKKEASVIPAGDWCKRQQLQ
eukprot:m.30583 g.30583  ORF g.30583 m.30583 type:complete len:122 (+) comp9294_c0_seq2:223-588(+)